jgi:tricorn protease
MVMEIDPRAEWQQIFDEAWRLERDFFYDSNMHGVNWPEMKDKYGQLVPYVAHRKDLNYLIGEMIGELCCSHTYVLGGDMPEVTRVNVGLMGADLEPSGGYYRFEHIYRGETGDAPLPGPGISVKEGEYLISVNGEEVHYPKNVYKYFENTVGKQVTIEVNDKPTPVGARELTIVPIESDLGLRYRGWVETNRRKVDEATNGRVGYIHIPDTSISGINEYSKAFFAQTGKEGLIIDVRYNAGGWVPERFMEHLKRKPVGLWCLGRTQPMVYPGMPTLYGHMVCIINEYAGSGGDAFPYYFHTYGLGPLIGKRTWGGLVGFMETPSLMDGGYVTCPSFPFLTMEGQWAIENHGVDPDIEVDNRPDLVIDGHDPQLEVGIEEVLRAIEENPPILPELPSYPVKD